MNNIIEKLEIKGLFGKFDYNIEFTDPQNMMTILTAPNGYGKSTILKIINSFAIGDNFYFIKENFNYIKFYISNFPPVEIFHEEEDLKNNKVTIRCGAEKAKIEDPFGNFDGDDRTFVVERALPFLTRLGPRTWQHDRTGEIFDRLELLSRYGSHPIFKRNIKRNEWLENIRKTIKVFSIPTNRLKSDEELDSRGHSTTKSSLMVGTIANDIKEKMQSAIRNQFEEGRKRETSFPTRLIESLKNQDLPTRESINTSIKSVQIFEERYSRLGLVPHTGTTKQLNMHAESTENAGMLILKTYLDDIIEKFTLLDDLAKRLDVFCKSINALIAFKEIKTSADEGIIISVKEKTIEDSLPLSVLSSGEQHLIVLVGKLVFSTTPNSLVLIDEPEISFHPEWQEKFLDIIEEIRELNGFSTLIATHSPILIGDRWDNVIELAEQHQQ